VKRLLVLGAGFYHVPLLRLLAGEGGFHVIAADRDPQAPGAAVAHAFAPVDIADREGILELCRREAVDGIMAINDFGARSAAHAAAILGLPGLDMDVAERANDKGLMRKTWQAAGLAQPRFAVVTDYQGLSGAVRGGIGLPCVVKPTDCGGSGRGVSVARTLEDLEWSFAFAAPYAANGRIIVEEFLDGVELTVESISIDGDVTILAISDKEKPDLRTRVALSLNYPARLTEAEEAQVRSLASRAVLAVGITMGMAHTEVILTSQGPSLVEIGARGGGGHIFHTCIEAVSGIKAPVAAARLLTAQPTSLPEPGKNGCVYRFFNPPRGILRDIRNVQAARQAPGVLDLGFFKKPGDEVGNLENSLQRAGFVVTRGQTRAEAMAAADNVERLIDFVVERTDTR